MGITQQTHSTQIHPSVQFGTGVRLGFNVTIESGVIIQDNCILDSNCYIGRDTILGANCHIFPGAVIGTAPQDLSYQDENSRVVLGNEVQVREYVTVHRATGSGNETVVGDNCLLMAYSHVGHNAKVGKGVILANAVQLGGYVEVDDYSNLGGGAVVHQFVRIGRLVMMSGNSATRQDLPPFAVVDGHLATIRGINAIGLKRKGLDASNRKQLKEAFKLLWFSHLPLSESIAQVKEQFGTTPLINELLQFVQTSKRGIRRRNQID